MKPPLPEPVLALAWRFPGARVFASRTTVLLLYHGVPRAGDGVSAATFDAHIRFLARHFELISPDEADRRRSRQRRLRVCLTFDDGFRNNAEVAAPILRKHGVPATFFISSRHATPGKYLWFSYLRALERWFPGQQLSFRETTFDMTSPDHRRRSIERLSNLLLGLRPHPGAMYAAIERELPRLEDFIAERDLHDGYAGMTAEQVRELASDPLFTVGAHTEDHPFLTRCDEEERRRQLQVNRDWLEAVSGQPCNTIAYPSGDYDSATLRACRDAAFVRGYAVASRIDRTSPMEIPRIGIYSASVEALGFKTQWASALRTCGLPVG